VGIVNLCNILRFWQSFDCLKRPALEAGRRRRECWVTSGRRDRRVTSGRSKSGRRDRRVTAGRMESGRTDRRVTAGRMESGRTERRITAGRMESGRTERRITAGRMESGRMHGRMQSVCRMRSKWCGGMTTYLVHAVLHTVLPVPRVRVVPVCGAFMVIGVVAMVLLDALAHASTRS
jgi:hypothetical protein